MADLSTVIQEATQAAKPAPRDTSRAFMSDASRDVRYRYLKIKQGVPEPPIEDELIFLRGRWVEDLYLGLLKERGMKFDSQALVPSPFPDLLDDGHVDALPTADFAELDVRAGEPIEIKSADTKNWQDIPYASNLKQLAMYVNFLDDAEKGHLVYVHPGTLESRTFAVYPNAEIKKELLSDLDALEKAVKKGELPAPCEGAKNPGGSPCTAHYATKVAKCPFIDTCWPEYAPEPIPTIDGEFEEVAIRLADIADELAQLKTNRSDLESERNELRDRIRDILIECGGKAESADVRVGCTQFQKTNTAWRKAMEGGAIKIAGELDTYQDTKQYETWTVRRS